MARSTTGQSALRKLLATLALSLWATVSSATHLGIVIDGSSTTPQVWIQQDVFQFIDLHVDTAVHQAVVTGYFPESAFFAPPGVRSIQVVTANVIEYFLFSAGNPIPNPHSPLSPDVQHFALTYLVAAEGLLVPDAEQVVTAGSLRRQCITAAGNLSFNLPPCEGQSGEFVTVDVNGEYGRPVSFPTGFMLFARAQSASLPATVPLVLLGLLGLRLVRPRLLRERTCRTTP